jgi:hypothetical protein
MKKFIFNLGFAAAVLGLATSSAWASLDNTAPIRTPDTATTALLLSLGVAGLAGIRRFLK